MSNDDGGNIGGDGGGNGGVAVGSEPAVGGIVMPPQASVGHGDTGDTLHTAVPAPGVAVAAGVRLPQPGVVDNGNAMFGAPVNVAPVTGVVPAPIDVPPPADAPVFVYQTAIHQQAQPQQTLQGENHSYDLQANNNAPTTLVGVATATDVAMEASSTAAAAAAAPLAAMVPTATVATAGEAAAATANGSGNRGVPVPVTTGPSTSVGTKKRRLCKIAGCQRVIKSQGLCQRHGASAKRCKVQGCEKQAQGTHDGMCKRHWKQMHNPEASSSKHIPPPPPEGDSVYESILPASISYRPTVIDPTKTSKVTAVAESGVPGEDGGRPREISVTTDALGALNAPSGINVMPLVTFLREGRDKEPGWHRHAERKARGMFPCTSLTVQLEPWERQLALVEILLLSGGTPHANFKDLAHAWGREKGFHTIITNNVCQRKGEVERKRRSDAGRVLNSAQREAFKTKMNETKRQRREPQQPGQIQQQQLQQAQQPQQIMNQQPTDALFKTEYIGQEAAQALPQQPHMLPFVQTAQQHEQNVLQFGQQPVVEADAGAVAVAAAAAASGGGGGGGTMNLQPDNSAEV